MTDDGAAVTAHNLVGALRQSDNRPGLGAYIPLLIWELEQGKVDTYHAIINNEIPPVIPIEASDPLVLRFIGEDLSPDAALFIKSGLTLREEARQLNQTADRFLKRGEEQITLNELGSSLAARFDFQFHEIMNTESLDRRLEINQVYLALPLKGASVENLKDFITQNFQGANADQLLTLTDNMTEADVEELAAIIFGKARDYATFFTFL